MNALKEAAIFYGNRRSRTMINEELVDPFEKLRIVGVGEIQTSNSPDETIITYSLGSCIGLTLFDPDKRVGGMLHAMLPSARDSHGKQFDKPGVYVDSGIDLLIRKLNRMGARTDRFIAKIAGCSRTFPEDGIFEIGGRNYAVLKQCLREIGIVIQAEDVGGVSWRTLSLHMESGETRMKTASGWRIL